MAVSSKKVKVVEEIKSKIEGASAIVFVDYKGLTVNETTELRRDARKQNVDYFVTKNRLFQVALNELGINTAFEELLEGTTSFAVSKEDPISPSKLIYDFSQKLKNKISIKGGYIDGKRVETSEVEKYAKLPSREQLLGQIAFGLLSPVRMLAVALSNVAEKKGQE